MPGYIEDRWFTKRPDPETGEKRKTARHGQGKRYRVAGVPGVRDRSFDRVTGPKGANAWLAKAQHESTRGEFVDPRDGLILLREYVEQEWWPSQDYADPGTEETVKRKVWKYILPHLGNTSLNAIKTPQLRVWLKTLNSLLGPSTVNDAWGTLSAILQSAVDDERITKNYCRAQKTVRPPARPEPRASAWSRALVAGAREHMKERAKLAVDLGVGAGLRQGEVFGLAVDDIDFDAQIIHVRRQVKKVGSKLVFALPKGQKTRTVPVPEYVLWRVREQLALFPAREVTLPWGNPAEGSTEKEQEERAPRTARLLLTAPRGGAWNRQFFNEYYWKPTLAAMGLIDPPRIIERKRANSKTDRVDRIPRYSEDRELGFHILRHTFASVQLDARESVVSVSKWMGHSDASITLRIYAHFMPEADGRGRAVMQQWFDGEP